MWRILRLRAQASPHFFRRDFNKLEIGQSVGRSIVVAPRGWPSFSFPWFRAGGNERRVNIRLLQMLMVHVGVKNEGIREPCGSSSCIGKCSWKNVLPSTIEYRNHPEDASKLMVNLVKLLVVGRYSGESTLPCRDSKAYRAENRTMVVAAPGAGVSRAAVNQRGACAPPLRRQARPPERAARCGGRRVTTAGA